jgi:hypothetical protein
MTKVTNTSTNGIVSTILISKIVDEVNRINDWLRELGYESPTTGLVEFYSRKHGQKEADANRDVKGADDFRVFAGRVPATLTKDKTDHGEVTLTHSSGYKWKSVTATVESSEIPAFATVKSFSGTDIKLDLTTPTKAKSTKKIFINVIAIADKLSSTTDY